MPKVLVDVNTLMFLVHRLDSHVHRDGLHDLISEGEDGLQLNETDVPIQKRWYEGTVILISNALKDLGIDPKTFLARVGYDPEEYGAGMSEHVSLEFLQNLYDEAHATQPDTY
jgi:hypothetical protein